MRRGAKFKSFWRRSRITTRPGDTWDKLRLALGSSKPWVSRSLRPWCVEFVEASPCQYPHVRISWGGNRVGIDMHVFEAIARELVIGTRCVGSEPILIEDARPDGYGFYTYAYVLGPDVSDVVLTTTETHIHYVDGERFHLAIPTKLVLEAVRIRRLPRVYFDGYSSNTEHAPKPMRKWLSRYRKRDRRAFVRQQGDHNRWHEAAIVARLVKDIVIDEIVL